MGSKQIGCVVAEDVRLGSTGRVNQAYPLLLQIKDAQRHAHISTVLPVILILKNPEQGPCRPENKTT
jgi:hypothetical protein